MSTFTLTPGLGCNYRFLVKTAIENNCTESNNLDFIEKTEKTTTFDLRLGSGSVKCYLYFQFFFLGMKKKNRQEDYESY